MNVKKFAPLFRNMFLQIYSHFSEIKIKVRVLQEI